VRKAPGAAPEATINLTIKHGVRAALEYAASGDIAKARAATNPDVAPHLEFVDMAGHGYAVVSGGSDAIDTEFICIVARSHARRHRWRTAALPCIASGEAVQPGTTPKLEQRCLKGCKAVSLMTCHRIGSKASHSRPCVADWAWQDRNDARDPGLSPALIASLVLSDALRRQIAKKPEKPGTDGRKPIP